MDRKFLDRHRAITLNEVYQGTVSTIREFGFFVRLLNTRERRAEGLVHISMIRPGRVNNIHNVYFNFYC